MEGDGHDTVLHWGRAFDGVETRRDTSYKPFTVPYVLKILVYFLDCEQHRRTQSKQDSSGHPSPFPTVTTATPATPVLAPLLASN